jgi:predicted membrane channel-forming protein YqfA (hemolysin III family)
MLVNRIGTFLIMVGLVLIGLYIASDSAGVPTCNLLLAGAVLLILGIFLWFRNPLPSGPPSGRFRILKGAGKKEDKK